MEKEYYEGLYGSLIHNIFLLLVQIEGNMMEAKKSGYKDLDDDLDRLIRRIAQVENAWKSLEEEKNR